MSDKKKHQKHIEEEQHQYNKFRKQRIREVEEEELAFDEENAELYLEVQRFLK